MQDKRENNHCKGSNVLTNDDIAQGNLDKQRKRKCGGINDDTESDSDLKQGDTEKRGNKQAVQSPPKKRRGISVASVPDSHLSEEGTEKRAINTLFTWSLLTILNKIQTKKMVR